MKKSILHCLICFPAFYILPYLAKCQLNNTSANVVMEAGTYLVIDNLDFKNNGTFNQTGGTVKFSGAANTVLAGSSIPQFYGIELNKPGASLQLQTGIGVNNQIVFTAGLLNLNNNNIILDGTASLNGESETSRISATTGGYIQITNTLNAPAGVNPGNLGAVITSAENLGPTIVRRGHVSQKNGSGMGSSIYRYYDIIPANNSALNATLGISYFDAELNSLPENSLTVYTSTNNTNWTDLGIDTRNTTTNYAEKTSIAGFARFTLSTPLNALPLIWNSFNTQCLNNGVTINWKTLQESNTKWFVIRRSNNGTNWQDLATINAAGNSNAGISYSYTDKQSFNGALYRIAEQDAQGTETVSPVLTNNCSINEGITISPNPVYNNCFISIQSSVSAPVMIWLYDSKGALIKQYNENVQAGVSQVGLQFDGLPKGIYSLIVRWGIGKIKTVKIEKL